MTLTIHVPKPDTPQRRLASYESSGRPMGRVAGGWIADLTGLKQTVMLCPYCVNKFHPRQHCYEVWRDEWLVIARCDGCKQHSRNSKVFIHQSLHDEIGDDRKRGRWVTRSTHD